MFSSIWNALFGPRCGMDFICSATNGVYTLPGLFPENVVHYVQEGMQMGAELGLNEEIIKYTVGPAALVAVVGVPTCLYLYNKHQTCKTSGEDINICMTRVIMTDILSQLEPTINNNLWLLTDNKKLAFAIFKNVLNKIFAEYAPSQETIKKIIQDCQDKIRDALNRPNNQQNIEKEVSAVINEAATQERENALKSILALPDTDNYIILQARAATKKISLNDKQAREVLENHKARRPLFGK